MFWESLYTRFKSTRFCNSFRFKVDFLYVLLLDLCYYLILGIALLLMFTNVIPRVNFLRNALMFIQGYQGMPTEQLLALAPVVSKSFYWTAFLLAAMFIVLLAAYSFFKGMIWARLLDKKYSMRHFLCLCCINIVVLLFVLLLFYIVSTFVSAPNQATIFLVFVLPLSLHFLHTANALLVFDSRCRVYFKNLFAAALKNIHKFIIPYTIMAILLLVLMAFMVKTQVFSEGRIYGRIYYFIYLILFVAWANWSKYYVSLVIKKFI